MVLFQVKDSKGEGSSALTEEVLKDVKNISEGFSSPGDYKGTKYIRICICNMHTTHEHIDTYFNVILKLSREVQGRAN